MKKITKTRKEYEKKIKTKASKEQLAKFKECFEAKCENENELKMKKTIKYLSEQKLNKN